MTGSLKSAPPPSPSPNPEMPLVPSFSHSRGEPATRLTKPSGDTASTAAELDTSRRPSAASVNGPTGERDLPNGALQRVSEVRP